MDFQQIKDFFLNELFAGYSHQDTLVFGVLTFLAFALGFLVAYFAGRGRRKKLKKELKKVRHELNNTKAELAALQEQHELKTAALQKAELTAEDLQNRIKILESEKSQLHTDLYNANEEIEKLNASAQAYAGTIDDLNNQIIGLKTKADSNTTFAASDAGNGTLDAESVAQMQSGYNAVLNRLVSLEEKLNELDVENEMLKANLDKLKSGTKLVLSDTAPVVTAPLAVQEIKPPANKTLKEVIVLTPAQERAKATVGSRIPLAEAGKKDDLTLINGVGPFLEKKLNNIGIYTYEQISRLDAETIEQVTEAIEFFPGRIEKDDWVGQANRLLGRGGHTLQSRAGFITTHKIASSEKDDAVQKEEILDKTDTDITTDTETLLDETDTAAIQAQDEANAADEDTPDSAEELAEEILAAAAPTEETEKEADTTGLADKAGKRIELDPNPFGNVEENDLKIIEGIGPKISEVLTEAGIDTWQKLSEADVEKLKEILSDAGSRFNVHDPSTWPQQAVFAAEGNWKKLKEYQDYLVGGKDVAEG